MVAGFANVDRFRASRAQIVGPVLLDILVQWRMQTVAISPTMTHSGTVDSN